LQKNKLTKLNPKKILVSALLMALLCSSLASMANARPEDNTTQTPPQEDPLTVENPTLYTIQENTTTTPDDNPTIYQQTDNSTINPRDEPPKNNTEDAQLNDSPILLTAQAQPDNTGFIIVGIALVAVIAISTIMVVSRKRKQ
jgi:hypothetical protein